MSDPTFTRRTFFGAAGAAGVAGAAAAAGAVLLAPEASSARPRPTVTTLGDSLSDTIFFPDAYPHWLPRYLPRARISARGEAGDLTRDVLGRCREDGIVDYIAIGRLRGFKPPRPVPAGRYCAVLAGVNDLCHDVAPSRITNNLFRIYSYLRRHSSTPLPITILPWAGSLYFRPRRESVRLAVNDWIRRQPHAIDVELLMGDGGTPPALRRVFDGGDGLHPVGEGPKVLARAVASSVRRQEHLRARLAVGISRRSPGARGA